jgi:hypothetical protein
MRKVRIVFWTLEGCEGVSDHKNEYMGRWKAMLVQSGSPHFLPILNLVVHTHFPNFMLLDPADKRTYRG